MHNLIPESVWTSPQSGIVFSFAQTQDNSYSVSLKSPEFSTEYMHSEAGAFSETIYLYEPVLSYAFEKDLTPTFLCVGLGMGYIELICIAFFLKKAPHLMDKMKIYSYEKEEELRSFFCLFLSAYPAHPDALPMPFFKCYEDILMRTAAYYGLEAAVLAECAKQLIQQEQLMLSPSWTTAERLPPCSGVFFDAFSAGTTPELWEQEAILHVIQTLGPRASFATYASRTKLKELLHEMGFVLEPKKGFGPKKESTFAYKP
jgi:hypothetical protein